MTDSERPPIPRNRTRAQKYARGMTSLEVLLTPEHRAAIDQEAERLGLSRAGLVAKWAETLAKLRARRNRRSESK